MDELWDSSGPCNTDSIHRMQVFTPGLTVWGEKEAGPLLSVELGDIMIRWDLCVIAPVQIHIIIFSVIFCMVNTILHD